MTVPSGFLTSSQQICTTRLSRKSEHWPVVWTPRSPSASSLTRRSSEPSMQPPSPQSPSSLCSRDSPFPSSFSTSPASSRPRTTTRQTTFRGSERRRAWLRGRPIQPRRTRFSAPDSQHSTLSSSHQLSHLSSPLECPDAVTNAFTVFNSAGTFRLSVPTATACMSSDSFHRPLIWIRPGSVTGVLNISFPILRNSADSRGDFVVQVWRCTTTTTTSSSELAIALVLCNEWSSSQSSDIAQVYYRLFFHSDPIQ